MRNVIGAITALGLMAVPVAATAGTRASDVVPAAASIDRAAPAASKKSKKLVGALPIIIGVIAVGTGIAIIASDDEGSDG